MEYDIQGICDRLFNARKSKGISQKDAGKILGIGQASYSDIENGKRDITVRELFILANTFDVPVEWLLGIENKDLSDTETRLLKMFKEFLIYMRRR